MLDRKGINGGCEIFGPYSDEFKISHFNINLDVYCIANVAKY